MENLKLAVCLNVFNAESIIEEVLESLLKQSYKEFYVILVDNGSTDKTLSICDNFIRAITFAGIEWPDIYIFKAEIHKEKFVDFLERIFNILKKNETDIQHLYFVGQSVLLPPTQIEEEILRIKNRA